MAAFSLQGGAVEWNGVRLSATSVERLLDLFEDHGDQPEARSAFNELYELQLEAGGIPRGTSLRVIQGGRAA